MGPSILAATVVVPPSMAERLNTDTLAVLAVIRDEAKATGRCTLPVARIAERANIGRAKTRAAIRLAESLGAIGRGASLCLEIRNLTREGSEDRCLRFDLVPADISRREVWAGLVGSAVAARAGLLQVFEAFRDHGMEHIQVLLGRT
jgi:hypothetical protein